MRLLVATYRLPWHSFTADRYTIQHFLKHFSQRHTITLVAFVESRKEARQAEVLKPFCHRVVPVVLPPWRAYLQALRGLVSWKPLQVWLYHSSAMMAAVRQIVDAGEVDLAYIYHLRMGQYFEDIQTIPRCLVLQPIQTLNLQRYRDNIRHPLWKLFYTLEYRHMRRYEPRLARKFDRCLLISKKDQQALDPQGTLTNIVLNPHGVDPEFFTPDAAVAKEPGSIVFHGSMRYHANADAIQYFAAKIYPLVKQQAPEAKLVVVGYQPPPAVMDLARDPSITVTGSVPDVRDYLRQAQVAIDPLRIGAGLQNKVLESMSTALPVVATTIANEGIGATPGEHLMLADSPKDFALRIVELLKDQERRQRLGDAARGFIERYWSWEAHYHPLENLFESLLRQRQTGRDAVGVPAVMAVE